MLIEFKGKGYATEANALRHIAKHTPVSELADDRGDARGIRFMVAVQGGRFYPVVMLMDFARWRMGYFLHNGFYVCG